ncbi:hypothetical protein V6N00_12735 [Tersicoccus sp. MR15.9]|uniref:hypothetical protein n=1 Tax=Tersicoccus mangrovi TaxID=3121635 RepID=UPI002FE6448D
MSTGMDNDEKTARRFLDRITQPRDEQAEGLRDFFASTAGRLTVLAVFAAIAVWFVAGLFW